MSMEWRGRFENQISPNARDAANDLRALQGALVDAGAALEKFQALTGATTFQGPQGPAFSTGGPIGKSPWEQLAGDGGAARAKALLAGNSKATPAATTSKGDDAGAAALGKASKAAQGLKGGLGQVSAVGGLARTAVLGLAAAAGVAGGGGLLKLALGYQGMARFQALTYRLSLDFRALFSKVDPGPALRAFERFEKNFSKTTVTGKALEGIITRSFNGLFSFLEKAEPYVTAFGQGMVLAGLYVEQGILRARLALYPYTSALEDAIGAEDGVEMAAIAGGIAVAGLGAYAAVATAPLLPFAAAIAAVTAAIEQAIKLYREWDSTALGRKIAQDFGLLSQAEIDAQHGYKGPAPKNFVTGDIKPIAVPESAVPNPTPVAATNGVATGKALGDGLVKGLAGSESAVRAAGGRVANAADKGVRDVAQIHSPSRKFEQDAKYMGDGTVRGLDASKAAVQAAAERSLVPSLDVARAAGGVPSAGAVPGSVTVNLTANFPNVRSGAREDIEAALEQARPRIAADVVRELCLQLGVSTEATT
jgi:hypothetical protein